MSFPRLALVASALLVWILTGCTALPANPLPKIDLGELQTEETEVDRELLREQGTTVTVRPSCRTRFRHPARYHLSSTPAGSSKSTPTGR